MNETTSCPEAILNTIPWYPEGLSEEERGAVESHASDCRACRAELAFLHGDEEPAFELPDAERVYASVIQRIDSYEESMAATTSVASPEHPARRGPLLRVSRHMSIAAGLLVAVVSGVVTGSVVWIASESPRYETASGPPPVAAGGVELDVVFRAGATAEQIASGLRALRASLVSGPTQLGVYRVRLEPGADVDAALERLRGDGRGVADFAERRAG